MTIEFSISQSEMIDRERFMVSEDLPDFGNYRDGKRQASARESELHELFFLLSLHRFGVEPSIEPQNALKMATTLSADFFEGDWWTQHKRDLAQLSRDDENDELEWLKPFRLSFLFAAIRADEQLARSLSRWPKNWMKAEWRATPFPDGIEQFYFLMITRLGLGEIDSRVESVDNERIELLYRAVENPSSGALETALNKSLQLFASAMKGKKVLPYEAIAIEETIIIAFWRMLKETDLLSGIRSEFHPMLLLPTDAVNE